MAFQDFELITERRRNENKLRMRKKILISVVSAVLLACVVGAATFVVVQRTGPSKKTGTPMPGASATPHVDQNSRLVEMICSSAEYKEKCKATLGEALKKDPKLSQPKDLIMVSMILAENEVNKAFNATANLDFASAEEKGAYSDCKEMFDEAKEELKRSIAEVGDTDAKVLSTKAAEINNWLSAVMSYQQTCIDGIPEGKLKTEFEKLFAESRELVSNSLAVMSQFSSFFSIFQGAGDIHLPWETPNGGDAPAPSSPSASAPGVAPAGSALAPGSSPRGAPVSMPPMDGPLPEVPTPAWAGPSDFLGSAEKPTPNVTVAQDGSGDFKTISEALAAIQTPYEGRYQSFFSFDYFKVIFVIYGCSCKAFTFNAWQVRGLC